MTQTLKTLIPLAIVFAFLIATNFIYAAWSAPAGTPSAANNAPAPINATSNPQSKGGLLGAVEFLASQQVNSDLYCDQNGANCTTAADIAAASGGGGIGDGQTWQVVNRVQGTWYQNTTGRPIMVFHKNISSGTNISVGPSTTNFVNMDFVDYDSDLDNGSTLIIPTNHYYRMNTYTADGTQAYQYKELR